MARITYFTKVRGTTYKLKDGTCRISFRIQGPKVFNPNLNKRDHAVRSFAWNKEAEADAWMRHMNQVLRLDGISGVERELFGASQSGQKQEEELPDDYRLKTMVRRFNRWKKLQVVAGDASEQTAYGYSWELKRFVTWAKSRKLDVALVKDIGKSHVQAYLDDLVRQGLALQTRKVAKIRLSAFWTWLGKVHEDVNEDADAPVPVLTRGNVVRRCEIQGDKNYQGVNPRDRAFTLEDVNLILNTVYPPYFHAVKFLTLTGLRRSELEALRWENVRYLSATEALVKITSYQREDGSYYRPKTKGSIREFTVCQDAVAILKQAEILAGGRIGYVFRDPDKPDKPMNARRVSEAIRKARIRSGVQAAGKASHALRATYISTVASEDGRMFPLMKRVGHTSPKITLGYYSSDQETDREFGNIMERALNNKEVNPTQADKERS